MLEFILNVIYWAVLIWVCVTVLGLIAMRKEVDENEKPTLAKVNGEVYKMSDIVIAEAEYVEQSNDKVWLLWDYHTKKFLTQHEDPSKIVDVLKQKFPDKAIFIKGLPEGFENEYASSSSVTDNHRQA